MPRFLNALVRGRGWAVARWDSLPAGERTVKGMRVIFTCEFLNYRFIYSSQNAELVGFAMKAFLQAFGDHTRLNSTKTLEEDRLLLFKKTRWEKVRSDTVIVNC